MPDHVEGELAFAPPVVQLVDAFDQASKGKVVIKILPTYRTGEVEIARELVWLREHATAM